MKADLCITLGLLISSGAYGVCSHDIDMGQTSLQWTGYKFNEKKGVQGTFDIVDVTRNEKSPDVTTLMRSIRFVVDTASINSNDPSRDKKLALYVFGRLKDPGKMLGRVTAFDAAKKTARAELELNGIKREVHFSLVNEGDTWALTGSIDLLAFGMAESHELLSKACKLLHTGADGVSKTWSEVGLKVETKIKQTCP